MSITLPKLPMLDLSRDNLYGYTADQMHAHAAAVSAAKDAEIERLLERTKALYGGTMRQAAEIAQLRTELLVSLADNKGLRAEVAGLREDAARYRWLVSSCRSTSEHWGGRWSIVVEGPAPKSHDTEDDFDAAIDAALAARKGEA